MSVLVNFWFNPWLTHVTKTFLVCKGQLSRNSKLPILNKIILKKISEKMLSGIQKTVTSRPLNYH